MRTAWQSTHVYLAISPIRRNSMSQTRILKAGSVNGVLHMSTPRFEAGNYWSSCYSPQYISQCIPFIDQFHPHLMTSSKCYISPANDICSTDTTASTSWPMTKACMQDTTNPKYMQQKESKEIKKAHSGRCPSESATCYSGRDSFRFANSALTL